MRWPALAFISLSACAAQSASADDPKALLLKVREQVMSTLTRLPRYLCTETVNRTMLKPASPTNQRSCGDLASQRKTRSWKVIQTASDRLRLDVAVSGDSEMYSWAGQNRFQDRSLADLVGGGATSTGAFATFLGSLFGGNDATFSYLRASRLADDSVAEFEFQVPVEKSHYTVGDSRHHAVVAYEGSFLVGKRTFSLLRLTVHAIGVPSELGVCEDTTTLDYETKTINGSEFLLPKMARFNVISANGNELMNRTSFSACHEFRGESTVHFGSSSEAERSAVEKGSARTQQALPAGLLFTFALTQAIDPSTAAAGDVVKGKIIGAIRDKHKNVLVAKNSPVFGRIVQVEEIYGVYGRGVQSLRVGIELESIQIRGQMLPFAAQLQSFEKRRIQLHSEPHAQQDIGTADRLVRSEELGSFDQMINPSSATTGYLFFDDVTPDYVIRAGTEMTGTTVSSRP